MRWRSICLRRRICLPRTVRMKRARKLRSRAAKEGSFVGQVFKTIADPFVGKISLVKIYRGILKADTQLYNSTADKAEKFGNVATMLGKKVTNIVSLEAGGYRRAGKAAIHQNRRYAVQCGGKNNLGSCDVWQALHFACSVGKKQEKRIKSLPGCAGWKRKTRLLPSLKTQRPGICSFQAWASCISRRFAIN